MRVGTWFFRILFSTCLLVFSAAAAAQSFPAKPVRIVVAYGPGVVDTVARLIAQRLSDKWGQPVIVEDKPGAGGNIAAELVARSAPDGHTLLVIGRNIVINGALFGRVPYTVGKDLLPVSLFANLPFAIVTNPSLPVRNLQELIAYARANPGKLNFGSGGHGTTPHLSGELFKLKAKLDMVHIPFKGSGATAAELAAGRIQLAIDSVSPYLPFIESGKVRAIAAAGATRIANLPNVPTVKEAGLADFETGAWLSIWAPGGVPASVIRQVNQDVASVVQSAEGHAQMAKLGVESASMTLEQLDAYMQSETRIWTEVIRVSGAKVN